MLQRYDIQLLQRYDILPKGVNQRWDARSNVMSVRLCIVYCVYVLAWIHTYLHTNMDAWMREFLGERLREEAGTHWKNRSFSLVSSMRRVSGFATSPMMRILTLMASRVPTWGRG